MPGKAGTLEILAQQIGLALQPLESRLAPENVRAFFAELGLAFPSQLLQPAFVNALSAASGAAGNLTGALNQLATEIKNNNVPGIIAAALQLAQRIRSVILSFPQIATELGNLSATLPGMNPVEVKAFAQGLPANLLSHSIISHLEDVQSGLVGIANLLGVVSYRPESGDPSDPTHPPFIERKLQLSNLGAALTAPAALLKSLYQWGGPGYDGTLLIPTLSASLDLLDVNSEIPTPSSPKAIRSGLFNIDVSTSPPGLRLTLPYDLPSGLDVTLPISPLWSVRAQAKGPFKAGLEAIIVPPSTFTLNSAGRREQPCCNWISWRAGLVRRNLLFLSAKPTVAAYKQSPSE
jgi:hypothetical protein